IGRMPPRPARMFPQASATVLPTGEIMPNPVMTTRRLDTVQTLCCQNPIRIGGPSGPSRKRKGRDHGRGCGFFSRPKGSAQVCVDIVDRLLDSSDLLGLFVRDL